MGMSETAPEVAKPGALALLEASLRSLLPGEHSSLTIGFNDDHAANYVTAQEWFDEWGHYQGGDKDYIDWASEEERLKALRENSVWTLQWYPNTPIGFNRIGASSLPALFAYLATQGD